LIKNADFVKKGQEIFLPDSTELNQKALQDICGLGMGQMARISDLNAD